MSETTLTVRGQKFPVTLTNYLRLQTKVGSVEVTADSRDELERGISRELTRQKVEHHIHVILFYENRYRRAILRGTHERTGDSLLTIDGEKVQVKHASLIAKGEGVSDEDLAELNRLQAVADEAARAVQQFRRRIEKGGYVSAASLIREGEQAAIAAEAP